MGFMVLAGWVGLTALGFRMSSRQSLAKLKAVQA